MSSQSSAGNTDRQERRRVSLSPPPEAKRQKTSSVGHELACPITLELPFDPVMAQDGRIYERAAIEEYFAKNPGTRVKSPWTNSTTTMIGKTLLPSPQIRNVISMSIENGTITGDLAAKWKEKEAEKKAMEELIKKAQSGDAESMRCLGFNYRYGKDGFKANAKLAFEWMSKAHKAGSLRGTTAMGEMLVKGIGTAINEAKGCMYLTLAAGQGSRYGAYWLGVALADGVHGIQQDNEEAIRWLKEALNGSCPCDNLSERGRVKAQEKLNQLTAPDVATIDYLSDDGCVHGWQREGFV